MSTNDYVLDSWAWVEYLEGSEAGLKIKAYVDARVVYTSAISIAEIMSKAVRSGKDADDVFNTVVSRTKVVSGDGQLSKEAGILHAELKKSRPNFSFGDAFALQTARALHAKVLTGDPDFKGLEDVEFIKK